MKLAFKNEKLSEIWIYIYYDTDKSCLTYITCPEKLIMVKPRQLAKHVSTKCVQLTEKDVIWE